MTVLDDSLDNDIDDIPFQQRSLVNELTVLFTRATKEIFRNQELFIMQLFLAIFLALFVGAIFNDVTNDLAGFQNRMGVSRIQSSTVEKSRRHENLSFLTGPRCVPGFLLLSFLLWLCII
jgi:hypothetical protein